MHKRKLLFVFVLAQSVYASGIGGSMVWDAPMARIAGSLTSTTAGNVGLIALFAAVVNLIWHQDMGQMGKMLSFVAIGISVLLLGASFISGVFGTSGAVI